MISILLIAVYDNEEKEVNKRNILNNEYKYIEVVHFFSFLSIENILLSITN